MTEIEFPTSPEEAAVRQGAYRAGGTDLQERIRTRGPGTVPRIVDLRRVPGLTDIVVDDDGATIGSMVAIADVASHPGLRSAYPGLSCTAGGLATPQVRRLGTIGGNLLQTTRCWYARHPYLRCFKNGGDTCLARDGQHLYGVAFDRGPCVAPHPSSIGMALLAYDATIRVHGCDETPVAELWGDGSDPTRDHVLDPGDVVTGIRLPARRTDERAAYFRAISRFEAEWPLVEAVACIQLDGDRITNSAIAVGGVANTPLRLRHVEEELAGKLVTPDCLRRVSGLASAGANPLRDSRYKLQLLEAVVLEVLERATGTSLDAPNR